MKDWLISQILTMFDERLGESNTEREIKISTCISKEGTLYKYHQITECYDAGFRNAGGTNLATKPIFLLKFTIAGSIVSWGGYRIPLINTYSMAIYVILHL